MSQARTAEAHALWVKITHWIGSLAFSALAVSGLIILMCHPRLYWGETGNDLTSALFELPISRNYQHGGWTNTTASFDAADAPVSSSRTCKIFNQNGWERSLHFLAAWCFVVTGLVYLGGGILTGHFRRHLLPRVAELSPRRLGSEVLAHLRLQIRPATGGPQYGLLQRCAYLVVVFLALPSSVLSGLAMSPAITAAYPAFGDLFGGFQSARTIHFFTFRLFPVGSAHLRQPVALWRQSDVRGAPDLAAGPIAGQGVPPPGHFLVPGHGYDDPGDPGNPKSSVARGSPSQGRRCPTPEATLVPCVAFCPPNPHGKRASRVG